MSRQTLYILAASLFLFALVPTLPGAAAQASSSLTGNVCYQDPYYGYDPAGSAACGRGVPQATLTLSRAPVAGVSQTSTTSTATADDAGRYTFSNLVDGDYTLAASHAGFATASVAVKIQGATKQDLSIVPQEVTVTGFVKDADGKGIKARVGVCCGQSGEYVQVTSAADGSYTAKLLAGYRNFNIGDAPGFVDHYEERFVDGSAADFVLERVPPQDATLRGTVRDQDGNPLGGLRVDVYNSYEVYPMDDCINCGKSMPAPYYYYGNNHTVTAADGTYLIHVYGGSAVEVTVNQEGYASTRARVEVAKDATVTKDLTVKKFPAKTAHIEGRVVDADTGKPIPYVSVNTNHPEYGIYECSDQGGATATKMVAPGGSSPDYYPNPGCAIKLGADGTFTADLTPGYTILNVWVDSWRMCSESSDADGSYSRTCGPEYFGFSQVYVLKADATTNLEIRVQSRGAPDAVLQGYLLNGTNGVVGAHISVYSEQNGGSGYAKTDGDGSFKMRLRSGYHRVSVNVDGYLPWEGVLMVKPGDNRFDVELTKGDAAGYCCYGITFAEGDAKMTGGGPAMGSPGMASSGTSTSTVGARDNGAATGTSYEDLGGGLGPYKPGAASTGSVKSPAGGLMAVMAGLAVVLALSRRKPVA